MKHGIVGVIPERITATYLMMQADWWSAMLRSIMFSLTNLRQAWRGRWRLYLCASSSMSVTVSCKSRRGYYLRSCAQVRRANLRAGAAASGMDTRQPVCFSLANAGCVPAERPSEHGTQYVWQSCMHVITIRNTVSESSSCRSILTVTALTRQAM
jgi:hypothetical protein